ncbi:hypothetical protein H0H87_004615 [Tephrocybe sp. NHM501043]|nr:hypothetical protein H0H87_004615 [Tephrocybe sp. NHM501043]
MDFRNWFPERATRRSGISKDIYITERQDSIDDQFALYLNGSPLGSSPTTQDIWKTSQKFTASLNAGLNLFAVQATNLGDVNTRGDGPAGLLAAIQITFSDGTTSIITSDSTWRSSKTIATDFQSPSLDDSSWAPAIVITQYGSGPWGSRSSEAASPSTPAQARAFRKAVMTPSGKTLKSALIILTVDDGFTLYVNGALIGSSPNQTDIWKSAQRFAVPLSGTLSTLFAIKATNLPDVSSGGESPAGLLATIQIIYTDGKHGAILEQLATTKAALAAADAQIEEENCAFDALEAEKDNLEHQLIGVEEKMQTGNGEVKFLQALLASYTEESQIYRVTLDSPPAPAPTHLDELLRQYHTLKAHEERHRTSRDNSTQQAQGVKLKATEIALEQEKERVKEGEERALHRYSWVLPLTYVPAIKVPKLSQKSKRHIWLR